MSYECAQGLGVYVRGSFRGLGLGFGYRSSGTRFSFQVSRVQVQGIRVKGSGSESKGQGLGFRGSGLRDIGWNLRCMDSGIEPGLQSRAKFRR